MAFNFDLSNGSPSPFVASTTIPRFLFAGWPWVAVFYTKIRVTIQATGRGYHPIEPVHRDDLGDFLDYGFRHKLVWFVSLPYTEVLVLH